MIATVSHLELELFHAEDKMIPTHALPVCVAVTHTRPYRC